MSKFYYGEEITLPLPSGFEIVEDDERAAVNKGFGTLRQFNDSWYVEEEETDPYDFDLDNYHYIYPAYTPYYAKFDVAYYEEYYKEHNGDLSDIWTSEFHQQS